MKLQELAPRPKTQLDYTDKQGQRQRDNLAKTMGYIAEKLSGSNPTSLCPERPRREDAPANLSKCIVMKVVLVEGAVMAKVIGAKITVAVDEAGQRSFFGKDNAMW